MDKRWINLNKGNPQALTASDIPLNSSPGANTISQTISSTGKPITTYTYIEDLEEYSSSSESWVNGLSLVIPPTQGHNYRISWAYSFKSDKAQYRVIFSDTSIVLDNNILKDSEDWSTTSGFTKQYTTGDTITIQYKSTDDDEDVHIKNMRLEFWELD